jgi:hypothetical protein
VLCRQLRDYPLLLFCIELLLSCSVVFGLQCTTSRGRFAAVCVWRLLGSCCCFWLWLVTESITSHAFLPALIGYQAPNMRTSAVVLCGAILSPLSTVNCGRLTCRLFLLNQYIGLRLFFRSIRRGRLFSGRLF